MISYIRDNKILKNKSGILSAYIQSLLYTCIFNRLLYLLSDEYIYDISNDYRKKRKKNNCLIFITKRVQKNNYFVNPLIFLLFRHVHNRSVSSFIFNPSNELFMSNRDSLTKVESNKYLSKINTCFFNRKLLINLMILQINRKKGKSILR